MKIFGIAAALASLVLVSMTVHRRTRLAAAAAPGDSTDLRYAIDDLLTGLD